MLSRRLPIALRTALGLALIALVAAPGCSVLFADGPPPGHEHMRYFDCTSSRAAPIIDTIVGVTYGVSGVALVAEHEGREQPFPMTVSIIAVAVASAASAVHGYRKTSECEQAKQQWMQRQLTAASQPSGACGNDRDCKGDRICEAGLCVAP